MGRGLAPLVGALLLALPLAGCLGFGAKDAAEALDANAGSAGLIDNSTVAKLESRLSAVPKNYTFPGQALLPTVTHYVNGTVDMATNAAVEDKNDRSGTSYNVVPVMEDVSKFIPAGQPTEMHVTLYYENTPGTSAQCDIAVDVPGTRTQFYGGNNDELNWKFSVQRMVINTVGVPGQKHELGVACANGRMAGGGVPYQVRVDFAYERDVLTPYLPYAFQVPANATGVVVESAKAGGPEHLKAWFMVVGPDDELVQFVDFNDIAIPTESVFIPTKGPGEYVFYAHNMTGGFLRIRSDAPVEDRAVRPLALKEERVVDHSGAAPGMVERDWLRDGLVVTPGSPGAETNFNVDGAFPLRIEAFIGEPGAGSNTAMSEVRISSSKGLVASLQRVFRHDDERGSIGLSQDEFNRVFDPANLARGAYTVQIVNNSPDATLGHVVTTYVR